jgi:hypothetical protein
VRAKVTEGITRVALRGFETHPAEADLSGRNVDSERFMEQRMRVANTVMGTVPGVPIRGHATVPRDPQTARLSLSLVFVD